jgi:hypothetical protein
MLQPIFLVLAFTSRFAPLWLGFSLPSCTYV